MSEEKIKEAIRNSDKWPTIEEVVKLCGTCKKEKPLTEFNVNKNKKDGRQSQCRKCHSEYLKKYRERNNELDKKYKREVI